MKKHLAAAAFALVTLAPAAALADWHRSFVVDWYEIPIYWSDNPATENVVEDTNCIGGENPKPDWHRIWKTDWRPDSELSRLDSPGGVSFGFPLADRGPNPGMNVHRDPTLVDERTYDRNREVTGSHAYGFDLDHNAATGGFTSPDGAVRGVDNQLYRSIGCFKDYYGRPHQTGRARSEDAQFYNNDEMRTGNYAILIVLSGTGDDPRNDPNVKVGIYIAKEALEKLADNEISPDVSYRIDPDPRFSSLFDAKSVNGVITPQHALERLNVRDHGARPYHPWDLELLNPQIRIELKDNNRLDVLMAGYRNWKQYYLGWEAAGNVTENARQISLVGLWHSLETNADGVPDPETGKNTAISATYRMEAVPAFVISPETNEVVTVAQLFTGLPRDASPDRLPRRAMAGPLGGNVDAYLDGGALAWPRAPRPDIVQKGGDPAAAVASAEPTQN